MTSQVIMATLLQLVKLLVSRQLVEKLLVYVFEAFALPKESRKAFVIDKVKSELPTLFSPATSSNSISESDFNLALEVVLKYIKVKNPQSNNVPPT